MKLGTKLTLYRGIWGWHTDVSGFVRSACLHHVRRGLCKARHRPAGLWFIYLFHFLHFSRNGTRLFPLNTSSPVDFGGFIESISTQDRWTRRTPFYQPHWPKLGTINEGIQRPWYHTSHHPEKRKGFEEKITGGEGVYIFQHCELCSSCWTTAGLRFE